MKQAFAVFCVIILMPSLHARAWVGGPFSNNNALASGDDGIYEAVATMNNGMGLYRWAVRNNGVGATGTPSDVNVATAQASNVLFGGGILGGVSSNVWYFKGITYYGPAFGIVNSTMKIVSVIGNASTDALYNGTGLNNQFLAGPTPGQAGAQSTGNVGFANSSFMAKIRSFSPVRRFSGNGVISFTGRLDSFQETIVFNGVTIPSGSTITQTSGSTGGEDSNFAQRGAVRSFKVMGTQVSTAVFP